MIKFIVPISIVRAAYTVQAKKDIRYYLNGIHFTDKRVEATDGHVAYMAKNNGQKDPEWFSGSLKYDVLISIDQKIPRSTRKENVIYAVFEQEDDKKFIVRYFDFLGHQLSVGQASIVKGKFPNIPKLISDHRKLGKQSTSVCFDTRLFLLPEKIFKRGNRINGIKLELFGKKDAAVVSYSDHATEYKETLLIMPMRM